MPELAVALGVTLDDLVAQLTTDARANELDALRDEIEQLRGRVARVERRLAAGRDPSADRGGC